MGVCQERMYRWIGPMTTGLRMSVCTSPLKISDACSRSIKEHYALCIQLAPAINCWKMTSTHMHVLVQKTASFTQG